MSAQDKFAKFRNRYRRVYKFERTPPDVRTFIDTMQNITSSVDVNKFIRDRDYFIIDKVFPVQTIITIFPFAEYEESLINFNNQDTISFNFITAFSNTPILTLDVWPSGEATDFVNPYINSISTTGASVSVSALTSGTLRYKAINLPPISGSYPAQIIRTPLFPSITTLAVAGTQTLINQNNATLSYNSYSTVDTGIPEFSSTTQDFISGTQADIYITKDSINNTNAIIDLSSQFSGVLNYLAIRP